MLEFFFFLFRFVCSDKYVEGLEDKKLKVIAIGLEDETENWKNEITKYPEFQHVLGIGKWNNPLVKHYNVSSTPTYFVLDKDKVITSKPYDYAALETYLKQK